ncbi:MAG TPA: diguanylate cyclase [Pyrinomonadaceae bacterium]|jgi:diguanylate cyclase (GGDEF)-like protein|nr:diguanylate cyclase [Pyrinomonadaceae bacterium]
MKRNEPTTEAPDNLLEIIADESGLAIIITGESGSVSKSNNNSICEHLYSSEEFAPRCAAFCGRAFQMATEAGESVAYRCHAGLDCLAVPLRTEKPLVAIVGRIFTKGENFEKATERAFEGDWQAFPQEEFFENVLINSSSKALETAAKRLEVLGDEVLENRSEPSAVADRFDEKSKSINEQRAKNDELNKLIEQFHQNPPPVVVESVTKKMSDESDEIAVWRSLFGSLFSLSYGEACRSIIKFLSKRYSLGSMAWLERKENRFESLFATGTLDGQQFKINIPANDKLLFEALESELSLELRERAHQGETGKPQTISLFPISVGGEVQSALVVADEITEDALKRRISRFCKTVASELEILRLREEVERRTRFSNAVERFNASLRNIDTEDFWANLMRVSAELMQAERSSLLVFDEKNNSLTVKAAVGATADRIRNKSEKIGERVARLVLQNGKPVVVVDTRAVGLQPAPSDWKYKTNSFISYPFNVGDRRVGVLNITDKADGLAYGEADLELLNAIAPQVAVLIDRAGLKSKAGEFEQLSVTDALTGLLNRRYLEERLAEEIKRSNRYGYPMSFMMIDVDNFKSYNDTFGHAEGDKALKIVADCFRETLRSADIAARYGGEEFSILLPQTTINEAETIAERLREHIEAVEFPNRQITVSIGIAGCCLELNSTHELIVAADNALYEAKRKGRNNVQVYEKIKDEGDTGKK